MAIHSGLTAGIRESRYERYNFHSDKGTPTGTTRVARIRVAAQRCQGPAPGRPSHSPKVWRRLPSAVRQCSHGGDKPSGPAQGSLRQDRTSGPVGQRNHGHPERSKRPGHGPLRGALAAIAALCQPGTAQPQEPYPNPRAAHRGSGEQPGGGSGPAERVRSTGGAGGDAVPQQFYDHVPRHLRPQRRRHDGIRGPPAGIARSCNLDFQERHGHEPGGLHPVAENTDQRRPERSTAAVGNQHGHCHVAAGPCPAPDPAWTWRTLRAWPR